MNGYEYTDARWNETLTELELAEIPPRYDGDITELVALPDMSQTQFQYTDFRGKENLYYFFQGMLLQRQLGVC